MPGGPLQSSEPHWKSHHVRSLHAGDHCMWQIISLSQLQTESHLLNLLDQHVLIWLQKTSQAVECTFLKHTKLGDTYKWESNAPLEFPTLSVSHISCLNKCFSWYETQHKISLNCNLEHSSFTLWGGWLHFLVTELWVLLFPGPCLESFVYSIVQIICNLGSNCKVVFIEKTLHTLPGRGSHI